MAGRYARRLHASSYTGEKESSEETHQEDNQEDQEEVKKRQPISHPGQLDGPNPPRWFVLQCDGCSVPTKAAKMFLRAEKFAWPCERHDFMYYLAALQWTPGSPQWQGYRFEADATLRDNIKLVAKNRLFGFLYSRIYFRGVRIGGRAAMKTPEELAVPPTAKSREHLKKFLDKPITAMAQRQLKKWEQ